MGIATVAPCGRGSMLLPLSSSRRRLSLFGRGRVPPSRLAAKRTAQSMMEGAFYVMLSLRRKCSARARASEGFFMLLPNYEVRKYTAADSNKKPVSMRTFRWSGKFCPSGGGKWNFTSLQLSQSLKFLQNLRRLIKALISWEYLGDVIIN